MNFKRVIKYEIKKVMITMIVLTACMLFLHISNIISQISNSDLFTFILGGERSSLVSQSLFFLLLLSIFVPISTFFFRTKAKQIDIYYALPIKRWRLYLAKSIAGMLLVLVPFSITYWMGFLLNVITSNTLEYVYYIPLYFIAVVLSVLIFGYSSFIFTRANNAFDGVVFIFLNAFILPAILIAITFKIEFETLDLAILAFYLSPVSSLVVTLLAFESKISYFENFEMLFDYRYVISLIFLLLIGVAGWLGMFWRLKYEKAEDAEHISESYFGYKTMIPAYIIINSIYMGTVMKYLPLVMLPMFVMIAVYGLIAYLIYRRGINLKSKDIITLLISIAVGILIGII